MKKSVELLVRMNQFTCANYFALLVKRLNVAGQKLLDEHRDFLVGLMKLLDKP